MSNVIYLESVRKGSAKADTSYFLPLTENMGDGVLLGRDDMNLGLVDIRYVNCDGEVTEQISLEPEKAVQLAELLLEYSQRLMAETKTNTAKSK